VSPDRSLLANEDMKEVWNEVQENHRRLDLCVVPHEFTVDITPDRTLFKRWACSKCGGQVDAPGKLWYERGLKDSRTS
jgi:hypothetical protein